MEDVMNGNQTEEMLSFDDEIEILPDDYEEGTDFARDGESYTKSEGEEAEEEEQESAEQEQEESEEQGEESNDLDSLGDTEIKFLHETKALKDFSPEDIAKYMQLGMNEERVESRDLTKANEQVHEFKEVAEMYGMDTEKLLDALKTQVFERRAKDEQRNIKDVRAEYDNGRKDMLQKNIDRFVADYPDINLDDLPTEMMDAAKKGKELSDSYANFLKDQTIASKDKEIEGLKVEIESLKKEASVNEQNAKSKKKGVVKSTKGSDDVKHDDFLDGLLGE